MDYFVLPLALLGTLVIEALGLQLIVGAAGLLTFGHAAFFAIGGYTSAALVVHVLPRWGLDGGVLALVFGAAIGTALAALLALCVAGPCLRLRGDYLAAATLGLSQVTENGLYNSAALGGASGFSDIPVLVGLPGIYATLALVWWMRWRLDDTPLGHAMVCSRDDEVVAQSFGLSPWRARLAAFVLGSALAGLAGSLYVHAFAFVSPSAAGFSRSVSVLLAIVLGGPFHRRGALYGAAMLVGVPEALRFLPPALARLCASPWVAAWLPPRIGVALVSLCGNAMFFFAAFVLFVLHLRYAKPAARAAA